MSNSKHPLSDAELDYQETLIPALAAAATLQAYAEALARGHSLVMAEGSNIILRHPDGTQSVIAERKPVQRVTTGKVIKVRKRRADQ
jgi:predicted RNA binding protein YcfA (HicA-like mRNA interferase family)